MPIAKKILFSFIALIIIPVLFLVLIELTMRIAGVGTSYDYFHEIEINNLSHYQDNREFANQFYPSSLGIAPLSNTFRKERKQNSIRVYVLGGSAAQGFPHPNHGLDRHLSAHLKAALPNTEVEVINTAMTSVNSHVVYEVAKGIPNNSADYAIILMGNNEVVGPYGPSTFSQNFLGNLTLIRALQALKRTRTWQALDNAISSAQQTEEKQELVWQGMQMFTEFSVHHDDPRLADVYSHYENNLRDTISLLQEKGMHVLLSSVPVNLRHSAPFGSAHTSNLPEADLKRWQTLNTKAQAMIKLANWSESANTLEEAIEINPDYAASHFHLATAYENLGKFQQAQTHYERALDLDTARFRSSTQINDIIASVAQEDVTEGLTYVDNVTAFANASTPYSPGWNLLHEHVHFDGSGNYILAREFTAAIMQHKHGNTNFKRLSEAEGLARVGFPNHETNDVMKRLVGMVSKPPFTKQSNAAELVSFTQQRTETIKQAVGTPADVIKRRQPLVDQDIADWKIHFELAELNRHLRNSERMKYHLSKILELHPYNHETYMKIAEVMSREGNFRKTIEYLEQSLNFSRGDETKDAQALGWLGMSHLRLDEYDRGVDYLLKVADDYPDQISAVLRAYGTLVKYAKDNGKTRDLNRYIAAVQNYAERLINQGKADQFPMVYRRMAQIMTIGGYTNEARKWQSRGKTN